MSREIINLNPLIAPKVTRKTPPILRAYSRLRSMPSGWYSAKDFRRIFSTNESHEIEQILTKLNATGWITASWWPEGGFMEYRITLNSLPEIPNGVLDAKNSIGIPKPWLEITRLFTELQEKVLGVHKPTTQVEYVLAKRLLMSATPQLVKRTVKEYWTQKADRRGASNFQDFYNQFFQLLNDAVVEEQRIAAEEVELRRANRPAQTRREWLVKEIKRCKIKGYQYADYEAELERLDG